MFVSQKRHLFFAQFERLQKRRNPKPIQTHHHQHLVRYCVDAFARWKWYDHGSGRQRMSSASFWVVSTPLFLCGAFLFGFKSHLLRWPLLIFGWCSFLKKRFHFNIPMKIVDLGNIAKHQVKQGNQNHHLQKESKLLPFFFGYSPLWVLSPRQHIVPSTKTRFFVK